MSQSKPLHFRLCLASPGGFEPLTPRLGGECSIQLSYEDMSDFWLKIGLSATFQASGSVTGYSITYAFWMNCSIQLSSIHSPLVASYIALTLTDSNYRVLFPIVQRRQASPFLRRHLLYPFNYENKCRIYGLFSHFGYGFHFFQFILLNDDFSFLFTLTFSAVQLESNSDLSPFYFYRV